MMESGFSEEKIPLRRNISSQYTELGASRLDRLLEAWGERMRIEDVWRLGAEGWRLIYG